MHRLEEKSKQIIEGSRRSAKISVIELSEKKKHQENPNMLKLDVLPTPSM